MKKTANRVLAVALALLMAFSCLTAAFAADGDTTNDFGYSSRGISEFATNAMSVKYLADMLDDMLKEMAEEDTENHSRMEIGGDIEEAIAESVGEVAVKALKALPVFKNLTNLTIDYSSIDAIMETADEVFVIWNGGTVKVLSLALGDVKDFKFNEDNWKTGLRRKNGDQAIFEQVIGLLGSNAFFVEKFLKGGLNPDKGGIDVGKILTRVLGDDLDDLDLDIYTMLKDALASTIYPYEKGNASTYIYEEKYNAAMGKKVDDIIFDDAIPDLLTGEGKALEGAAIAENDSINDLLVEIFNVCWVKYLVPLLNDIKVEYDENNELAMAFKDVVRLDFTGMPFDDTKRISGNFMDGLNDLLGYVIGQFIIPEGFVWTEGGFDKIGDNVKALFEFLLEKADFSNTAYAAQAAAAKASTNFDDKVLIVVKAVLSEFGGEYGAEVQNCASLKDMAFVVLKKVAKDEIGLTNTYAAGDDYLDVAADMLVFVADKIIPMDSVKGAELEDVIDYICNFYQFDRGFAKALNLDVKKTDSPYDKLNAILWIFYDATPKAERIDTETLLKGKNGKKSIFESILALDIQNILDITVKTLIDNLSSYTASKFVYSIVKNVVDNLFGMEVFTAYKTSYPFDNAFQNASLGAIASNLLKALDKNKSGLISCGCYVACAIMDIPSVDWKIASAEKYADGTSAVKLTGKEIDGTTAISRVLKSGKDYEVVEGGIKGINSYEGKYYDVSFKDVKAPAAVSASTIKGTKITATTATLTWTAVSGATGYIVKNGSTKVGDVKTNSLALKSLKANTAYKYSVTAYTKGINGTTYSAKATTASAAFTTAPAAVTGIKATPAATSIKLTWTAAAGATSYVVKNTTTGKSVTATSATASFTGLTANTVYKFTITPQNKAGVAGTAASFSSRTLPPKVTGVKASSITATSLKLTWTAVKGATSYTVYNATTKKTVKSGVTGTSLSITGLSAAKAYKFQVKATVKDSTGTYTGDYSTAITATTLFTQTKGLKATKATTSSISVSWTKVSGATSYKVYVNGKVKATVKTNKATLSKLTAGTTYSIYVVAYKSKTAGQASATIKVAAAPAKPTSLKASATKLLGSKSVKLTWKAVKGATSYNIYQGTKKIGTATKNTYTVKNLKASTKYSFTVQAVTKAANYTSTGAKSAAVKA